MPLTLNGTTGIAYPNGSAGIPALTGTDTDTGVFFGTDTVALTTAATRRLVVTSTGVIGIGATSVIQQGSGIDGGVAAGILELYNGSTGHTTLTNTGAYDIIFQTNDTPRLRITSSGNVGIGTTNPLAKLHVTGGRTYLASSDGYELAFARTGNFFYFYNDGGNITGKLSLTTTVGAGEEIITFTQNTRNVGIGTTNPFGRLSVASGAERFELVPASVTHNGGLLEYINRGNNTTRPDFNYYLGVSGGSHKFYTEGSEKFRIKADGNVGIGTTNPSSALFVYGDNRRINVYSTQDAAQLTIGHWDSVTNRIESVNRSLFLTTYSGSIHLGINGSNHFTISNSANVGIGFTNPRSKLDVNGYVYGTYGGNYFAGRKYAGYITATASGNVWLRIAYVTGRTPIRVTINTTGNYYSPGATIFTCLRGWNTNDFYVSGIEKLSAQYTSQVRMQSDINGGDYFIEILFSVSPNQLEQACHVTVECLGALQDYGQYVSSYGTNAANLTYTSSAIVL